MAEEERTSPERRLTSQNISPGETLWRGTPVSKETPGKMEEPHLYLPERRGQEGTRRRRDRIGDEKREIETKGGGDENSPEPEE